MPSRRSLKSVCLEVIVFVSMFALLGHLSMNFWENFIIQTELSKMKTSLHYLKNTVNQIGFVYDNLHRELSGIAEKTDKQQPAAPSLAVLIKKEVETQHQLCKELQSPDRRTLHDRHVQAIVIASNCTTLTKPTLPVQDKSAQLYIQDKRRPISQHSVGTVKRNSGKSVSTITRYPLTSTGTEKPHITTTLTKPVLPVQDKSAQLYIQDKRRPISQHSVGTEKRNSGKSVSTITRYPLTSTGTEKPHITCDDEECCNNEYGTMSFNQIHNLRCCKDHKCYNAYDNWKF